MGVFKNETHDLLQFSVVVFLMQYNILNGCLRDSNLYSWNFSPFHHLKMQCVDRSWKCRRRRFYTLCRLAFLCPAHSPTSDQKAPLPRCRLLPKLVGCSSNMFLSVEPSNSLSTAHSREPCISMTACLHPQKAGVSYSSFYLQQQQQVLTFTK